MDKHQPYNDHIERKLAQLPGADVDHLWAGMAAILDQKMPHKKERKRFLGWLFSCKGLMLAGVPLLSIGGYALYTTTIAPTNPIAATQPTIIAKGTKLTTTPTLSEPVAAKETDDSVSEPAGEPKTENKHTASYASGTAPTSDTKQQPAAAGKDKASVQDNGADNTSPAQPQEPAGNKDLDQVKNDTYGGVDATIEVATGPADQSATANTELDAAVTTPAEAADSVAQSAAAPVAAAQKKRRAQDRGPYAGVVVGVDLSSVKMQSMKTGTTKGLIGGYSFNRRWSVESGLLWDNKRIYSRGEHFKADGYTLPPGTTILTIDGEYSILEVPLNVRYNILTGKHTFFATTGLSSYFMKQESYQYAYEHNGQPGEFYASYKNEAKNWMSIANFSVGYSYQLGRLGALRVEPYLKLPLKELGIGNLPVMSTGLNVGFTRKLSK